jgi:hypothetical protein
MKNPKTPGFWAVENPGFSFYKTMGSAGFSGMGTWVGIYGHNTNLTHSDLLFFILIPKNALSSHRISLYYRVCVLDLGMFYSQRA